MSAPKFYLTTPIYYVNARPHIGHAYTTIVADVLARRHRLLGDDTFFLTGTDEHGQKIERSAAAAGIPPQQFADQVSKSFEDLWKRMGITHNDFIRTTDERHKRGVQKLFSTLYERGFIELKAYTGTYCVSDEAFVDVPAGTPCPDCGRITETITEENFFFKLSEFGERIVALIESNELLITPDSRRNEVLSFVKGGLKDLSISRSSFTWGIPVPEPAASTAAQKHVIYVWLDALANYMTALGYGSDDETLFNKFWPTDLHLVGKEIIRFHCIYWPAFLLAADLPLPKQITAHGWLLFDNSKMSKSKGNIVRTETILDAFGTLCPPPLSNVEKNRRVTASAVPETSPTEVGALAPEVPSPSKAERDLFASDVLRYYLLREIPFGQDGSFSFDALITRYNADLANGYGNLVSRTLSMIAKRGGIYPTPANSVFNSDFMSNDMLSYSSIKLTALEVEADISQLNFNSALTKIASLITLTDGYMTQYTPWKLVNSNDPIDQKKADFILLSVAESIRIITALLYPVLPFATAKVWAQLGLGDIEVAARDGKLNDLEWGGLKPGTKLGALGPIFPRADKGLVQIMTDMENPVPVNEPSSTSDPAAGPRTSSLAEPSGTLSVGGSTATTSGPNDVPTHTEAQASGIFAQQPGEPAAPSDASPQITIDDFAKVELRVAQILVAERIPKADKLLRLEVDLGYEKRQILSGIAEWYTPEDLIGRRIVVITNLAPRKMRGLESHGMLLAASNGEDGKPVLATFAEEITLGARLK